MTLVDPLCEVFWRGVLAQDLFRCDRRFRIQATILGPREDRAVLVLEAKMLAGDLT